MAEKLTQRDANGVPRRRGFDFNWAIRGTFWFMPNTMLHQLGATMIDEENYKATTDTPAARKVFHYFQDWANKYRLGGPQYTDSRTEFLGGRLGTDCSFGIWGIPQMAAAKIDWSVHPAPRFEGAASDNGIDAYAYYMMVNARSAPAVAEGSLETGPLLHRSCGRALRGRRTVCAAQGGHGKRSLQDQYRPHHSSLRSSRRHASHRASSAMTRCWMRCCADATKCAGRGSRKRCCPLMNDEMNAVLNRERARAAALAKSESAEKGNSFSLRFHFKWWGFVFVLPAVGVLRRSFNVSSPCCSAST